MVTRQRRKGFSVPGEHPDDFRRQILWKGASEGLLDLLYAFRREIRENTSKRSQRLHSVFIVSHQAGLRFRDGGV